MSNVLLNAGSGGATLGTDTVTGTPNVDYQIVKIGYSATGVAPTQVSAAAPLPISNYFGTTAASVNSGNLDAGTLRVVLATNSPSLTNANPVTQSGSWTVNLGTLNGVALDTSVNGLLIAQATALGTNKGPLIQGSVTTAAPTYTTGNINPLSLTTGGALRVDASAATVTVSGTVTANIGTSGSLALDASVTGLQVAQGSTTSGQKGGLVLGAVTTGAPSYTTAQSSPLSLDTSGNLRVNVVAGGITSGTAGSPSSNVVTVQGITGMTAVQSQPVAGTVNGASAFTLVSAASNNLTAVKASAAGTVYAITALNVNTNPRYIKFFDAATTGAVTMGTTSATWQAPLPGNTSGAGSNISIPVGMKFANGIIIAVTGGMGLTDNTAVSASDVALSIAYA